MLTTVPGAAIPYPYGGKVRQIQIDLDPAALQSKGLSAQDVSNAIAAQNQILPVGTIKIGTFQYIVRLNDSAETIEELNNLPIKTVDGATIYIHDVGQVRDGSSPQTNVVHVDGSRAVLSTILKNGSASTLAAVQGVKDKLPGLAEQLPSTFKITALNDQSLFVKGAISSVVKEGAIAAALTSLMILLFLGSWRSTVIIAISIPLAVLAAIAALSANPEHHDSGLALAVASSSTRRSPLKHQRHLEHGKDVRTPFSTGPIRSSRRPSSLLCICIVFVPMFMLKGIWASCSCRWRCGGLRDDRLVHAVADLVPTMAIPAAAARRGGRGREDAILRPLPAGSRRLRRAPVYVRLWSGPCTRAGRSCRLHGHAWLVRPRALPRQQLLPSVTPADDHPRARAVGTRLEDTSLEFRRVEATIKQVIPADELGTQVDNIGIPNSSINMVYSNSGVIGPQDGDIYVSLKPKHHATQDYVKRLREVLPRDYPGTTFAFLPADIVSQILNFGLPAPIDVQVVGPNAEANRVYANMLLRKIRMVRGLADVRMQQPESAPELRVDVDRARTARPPGRRDKAW